MELQLQAKSLNSNANVSRLKTLIEHTFNTFKLHLTSKCWSNCTQEKKRWKIEFKVSWHDPMNENELVRLASFFFLVALIAFMTNKKSERENCTAMSMQIAIIGRRYIQSLFLTSFHALKCVKLTTIYYFQARTLTRICVWRLKVSSNREISKQAITTW